MPLLIVSTPPQHGKSTLLNGFSTSWFIGCWPYKYVLTASYSAQYAAGWGGFARNLLERDGERCFGVTVDPSSHASNRWNVAEYGGGLYAAGAGTGVGGRRADLALIDDPYRNNEEAQNPARREKIWEWFQSDVQQRLAPGAGIILVMTRWHKDDLAGRLMADAEERGEPFQYLRFPAIAEANDILGRAEGEALWPESGRNIAFLERQRDRMGIYRFGPIYQGNPIARQGDFFSAADFLFFEWAGDWLIPYGGPASRLSNCRLFQISDPAGTAKGGAYFVIGTFALDETNKNLFVLDIWRGQIASTEHTNALRTQFERFRMNGLASTKVEEHGIGAPTIQYAIQDGLPITPLSAGGASKEQRAEFIAVRYKAHAVYHLSKAPYRRALEEELVDFPKGAYKDQVDVMGYAGLEVFRREVEDEPLAAGHGE